MQVGTNISNVIDGNANKSRYDAEIKKILSDKQILAWILKYTTEEFKEYTIKKIISCIEGEPEVGTHPVSAGHYLQTIDGMNTEDTVPGEGKITYDIRFKASQPNGSTLVMVYLGREETVANGTRLHGLLATLLSDKLKPEQKKQILAQDYDIATTMELKGGIVRMCNLSDAIEEKGINKGIELGKKEGIKEQLRLLIEKKIQKGKPLEQIADELEETVEDIKPLYDEVVAALNK